MTVRENPDSSGTRLQPDWDEEALRLYEQHFRALLLPRHSGEVAAIHPQSGEFEVVRSSPVARGRLRQRCPGGVIVTMSVSPEPSSPALDRMLSQA